MLSDYCLTKLPIFIYGISVELLLSIECGFNYTLGYLHYLHNFFLKLVLYIFNQWSCYIGTCNIKQKVYNKLHTYLVQFEF